MSQTRIKLIKVQRTSRQYRRTAPGAGTIYCIWSISTSFSNLNRWSRYPLLFYHVFLKRDQGDWDWRLRLNDTPNAIGFTTSSSSSGFEDPAQSLDEQADGEHPSNHLGPKKLFLTAGPAPFRKPTQGWRNRNVISHERVDSLLFSIAR